MTSSDAGWGCPSPFLSQPRFSQKPGCFLPVSSRTQAKPHFLRLIS